MKKNDFFKTSYDNKTYKIAGRWEGDIILSPEDDNDDRCLIYTPGEMEELLEKGELVRDEGKKRALFGRKISGLKELKELTKRAIAAGKTGEAYMVTREVILSGGDFSKFAGDFLADQPWISPEDGGSTKDGKVRCIRVVNQETGEKVLINTEGYTYPRYTALEK